MGRFRGTRCRTGWMAAGCLLSMLLVVGCATGGATPSAAPASPSTAPASPATAPASSDRAEPSTQAATETTSPGSSAAAALPTRHVLDIPYMRNLMPAAAVGVEPGAEILLDVYAPEAGGPWPVVVWAPGGEQTKVNGWSFGEALASRGAVVLLVDTVHAMSPDQPTLGAGSRSFVEEASCAVRTARALAPAYGGDPERVVWSGHSLGGVVGFELALADPEWERLWTEYAATHPGLGPTVECLTNGGSDRIDAIVTAGSGRFIEMWAGVYDADPALRAFTESVSHIGNNPALIVRQVHGDPDPEQPFAVAQDLSRELTATGYDATLTRVDLGGHAPLFPQVIEQILGVVGSAGW
jgi:predicted esterase